MALYLDTTIHTGKVSLRAARTCIKSEAFDLSLLILPLATGLAAAAAVLSTPKLFAVLLRGRPLAARLSPRRCHVYEAGLHGRALRRNRFLAFDLLLLMTVVTLGLAFTAGAWVVATAFLYLQWFHYMRQGYGLSRMYFRATPEGQVAGSRDITTDLVIYLVPIYAIAARSATMGQTFLDLPVKVLVLPSEAITALGFAAAVAGVMWAVRSTVAFTRGTLDPLYAGFVLSHIAIFLVAYVAIEDANTGWLAINVWHNFQYVLVVWMMNTKKYAERDRSRGAVPLPHQPTWAARDLLRELHRDLNGRLSESRQRGVRDGRRSGDHRRHLHGHQLPPLHRRCLDLEAPAGGASRFNDCDR